MTSAANVIARTVSSWLVRLISTQRAARIRVDLARVVRRASTRLTISSTKHAPKICPRKNVPSVRPVRDSVQILRHPTVLTSAKAPSARREYVLLLLMTTILFGPREPKQRERPERLEQRERLEQQERRERPEQRERLEQQEQRERLEQQEQQEQLEQQERLGFNAHRTSLATKPRAV